MLKTPNITRPKGLEDLLEPALLARLGQMDISSRKIMAGKLKGERRSKRRGESVEFADHRPYVVGDDLRHIDWNIYGRLDKLFLKLFLEEEDLSLHIVVDCSASMDAGVPNKFLFAQKLAAALGFIGLVNLNRVAVSAIGDAAILDKEPPTEAGGQDAPKPGGLAGLFAARDTPAKVAVAPGAAVQASGLVSSVRDLRGKRRLQELVGYLCSIEPGGQTRFGDACKRIALSRRGRGVMVLISDFFIKEGYETGLRLLKGRGYDLYAIQVLSPEEMKPTLGGDLRLKDIEDADRAEVTITAPLLKKYAQTLNAYCNRLHEFCVQRDIQHITVKSDTAVDRFVLEYLRSRGMLR
jgi:hypothetical protein